MDDRVATALAVVIGVPAVLVGYIYLTEVVLRFAPDQRRSAIRPWLWLLPALLFLFFFLIFPTILTVLRSFQGAVAGAWVGLENYSWFFSSPDALVALRNSLVWVVFLTLFTVGLGLLIAVLVDRVRYESVAKSVIFVPLAISMTAAGVIWRFMFDYQSPGSPQTGTLNGILSAFGAGPISWLQVDTLGLNTIFLTIVMAWMWTGFAMVIAGLQGDRVPASATDDRRRLDDDRHYRVEGVRHHLRDDQWQLRHPGHRQPDDQGVVHVR